ncbi:lysophospholipid acyltransferase family protein [Amphritea japonica]|nr:lysophospholipid acyltransferase family protein [Amphritea japonica]
MVKRAALLRQWCELFSARVFRLLPIDVASGVGARIAYFEASRSIKAKRPWINRLHRNFEYLEGIADFKTREQRIIQHAMHIGRVYAEYPVLHKIARNRLSVQGEEHLRDLAGPVIFVSAHTGQWELILEVMRRSHISTTVLYDPIPEKVFLKVAMEVRRHLSPEEQGNRFIPASASATRELVACLKTGDNLILFIDEEKDGLVWAPALGRNIPSAGNRMMAARLSEKFKVPIIPIHLTRKDGADFEAVVESPLVPVNGEYGAGTAADLAELLNETLERWLKDDYIHWYWLSRLKLEKKFPERFFKKRDC